MSGSEIYDPSWCIEYCKSYAEQLRDKKRANRAEHAAECIEYLLSLVQKEWVGLTAYEIQELHLANPHWGNFACAVQVKLKEKNT